MRWIVVKNVNLTKKKPSAARKLAFPGWDTKWDPHMGPSSGERGP